MLKSITSFLARLTAGRPKAAGQFHPTQDLTVQAGDVVVQPGESGWTTIKVINVDDGTAHCLSYEPGTRKPDLASLAQAPIRIAHTAQKAASFAQGWEHIGNQAATARELQGLKYMDFQLFVQLTGQDPQAIVAAAKAHFMKAQVHGDEGRRTEAINEYGRAIDLFPLFHEALDARAFAFMELGLHQQALRDLEESLYIHPDGMEAFFSKGECLMKLGHLAEAEELFQEGQDRFPEHRTQFVEFLKRTRAFALTGRPA